MSIIVDDLDITTNSPTKLPTEVITEQYDVDIEKNDNFVTESYDKSDSSFIDFAQLATEGYEDSYSRVFVMLLKVVW